MPRNSAGTFALVAGNPVVDDTVIEASWANDTLNDIAAEIQDSLSRSGKGGMLVPMEFADGTVDDPSITFSAAPTTGLYRAGTNDVRFSLAGVDLITLTTALIKLVARVADGATAVGVTIDTANALTTTGAKLLSILNNAVEKFSIDKDGQIGPNLNSASGLVSTLAAVGATLKGNVADGATAVGVILDNVNALANAAAKALSVRVAGVEKAYVSNVGKGFFVGLALGGGVASGLGAPSAATDAMRYGDSFAAPSPVEITPTANWTAISGLAYWKDRDGVVHLKGGATWATGASNIVFVLPTGYRPANTRFFTGETYDASVAGYAAGLYSVASDGSITAASHSSAFSGNDRVYLDCIHFLAEP